MNANITDIEPARPSEMLEQATWNRPRSTEELLSFVARRAIFDITELDLDL